MNNKELRIPLKEILKIIGANLLNVIGSKNRIIKNFAPINLANKKSDLTFCSDRSNSAAEVIELSKAGVIICGKNIHPINLEKNTTLIIVKNPRSEFIRIISKYLAQPTPSGIHPSAYIDERAKIGPQVYIGPHSNIANCIIGKRAIIYGNVNIYNNSKIGNDVVIHAGAVIGADGFGFQREGAQIRKFPHLGRVIVYDNVEIGANSCIDRGTLGDTIIGESTKLDNSVHIGHNASIGDRCLIAASSMIAGSVSIGNDVWVGPGARISDSVIIGDKAFITIGSVVINDVPEKGHVSGNFAISHRKFLRHLITKQQ